MSCIDGSNHEYDGCIIASHAPDAIRILGKEATYEEISILGAFKYVYRFGFLAIYPLFYRHYYLRLRSI